ncbi:hypothetical protein [Streptomyces sp. NPDC020965]
MHKARARRRRDAIYQQGERDFGTLGAQFGRKPSAIRSRLAKLGLESID